MPKLMVLDGHSIANRAFYGVRMLNAPDGTAIPVQKGLAERRVQRDILRKRRG